MLHLCLCYCAAEEEPCLCYSASEEDPCLCYSAAEEDPCLPGRHRVISGQVERSFNYRLPAGEAPLCDRLLALGWYRFESAAGTNMPTACPGAGFCGTQSPIWLKGPYWIASSPPPRPASNLLLKLHRGCCSALKGRHLFLEIGFPDLSVARNFSCMVFCIILLLSCRS